MKPKKKLKTLRSLKKKAWELQSKAVRSSRADFAGYVQCYTCLKMILWKEANLGHFIHNKLDFDLRNLKVQCVFCNKYRSGELGRYAQRLIKENGSEWLDQLYADARIKGNDYKRAEIMEVINIYSNAKLTLNTNNGISGSS